MDVTGFRCIVCTKLFRALYNQPTYHEGCSGYLLTNKFISKKTSLLTPLDLFAAQETGRFPKNQEKAASEATHRMGKYSRILGFFGLFFRGCQTQPEIPNPKFIRILKGGGGDSPNLPKVPQSSLRILKVPQEHPIPLKTPQIGLSV